MSSAAAEIFKTIDSGMRWQKKGLAPPVNGTAAFIIFLVSDSHVDVVKKRALPGLIRTYV